ncbi:zinc finger protein 780A-like [Mya arenaria]|uniref:zinc finger protein 780A-like n=1 Tax=Mya arenaria TaxID=6604 RepID=UPI0022E3846F|nr:zinc finger protein 780A-like [Mya arenaria]XP_052804972.1 zinc finger protein 780A-like [Mya arenaria]
METDGCKPDGSEYTGITELVITNDGAATELSEMVARLETDQGSICHKCSSEFDSIKALGKHGKKVHPKESIFGCEIDGCRRAFSYHEQRYKHWKRVHIKPFKCQICLKTFPDKYLLFKHLINVHKDIEFNFQKCSICKQNFGTEQELQEHLVKHEGKRPHQCDVKGCDKAFKTAYSLKRHQQGHQRVKYRRNVDTANLPLYECPECDETFNSISNLERHGQNEHPGIKLFKCSEEKCDQRFTFHYNKMRHILTHSENPARPHQCHRCGFLFKRTSSLKQHILHVHGIHPTGDGDVNKYSCEKCDKIFRTVHGLKEHSTLHTGEKAFICSFESCRKAFRLKTSLQKHLKLHAGVRGFKCKLCDKQFSRREMMEAHVNKHAGIKQFVCGICKKRFSTQGNLTVHMNLHNGKKYLCVACGNIYNFKSNLNKHLKDCHPDQDVAMDYEPEDGTSNSS